MRAALARPIPIVGAGAISAYGIGWRGLGRVVREAALALKTSEQLAISHPNTPASEVTEIPEARNPQEKRARMLMSRSALLATVACESVLSDAGWRDNTSEVGFYLGVGASGGSIEQLEAMLAASIEEHELSLERFGEQGLRACNPLFAFQLMNNFTLCHAAIMQGTQGSNSAFFSRGSGTLMALLEACYAIAEGDCVRTLAGGADSCLHPVTWAELARGSYTSRGLIGGEGAALIALQREQGPGGALAILEHCAVDAGPVQGMSPALSEATSLVSGLDIDAVVIAPWGHPARDALLSFTGQLLAGVPVIDTTACLGEALAATPALAWLVGLDLLVTENSRRALVLSAGIDGALGVVVMSRGAAK